MSYTERFNYLVDQIMSLMKYPLYIYLELHHSNYENMVLVKLSKNDKGNFFNVLRC